MSEFEDRGVTQVESEITLELVRTSADRVLSAMSDRRDDSMNGYWLGYLVTAISAMEGTDAGHSFAVSGIKSLRLNPQAEFPVWVNLFANGDKNALPLARRAAGLASEEVAFTENFINLGGLHSAERLVRLVQAGDEGSIERARRVTQHAEISYRAQLFGKLYEAGDSASLDLAIQATKDVKLEIGDHPHYERSQAALQSMALSAVRNDKFEDVVKLLEGLDSEGWKRQIRLELYAKGRDEYLEPILEEMQQDEYSAKYIQQSLAALGYQPAIDLVRERLDRARPKNDTEFSFHLDDLVSLYKSGDKSAAERVSKIVFSLEMPKYYLRYLVVVGLGEEAADYLELLHAAEPTVESAKDLLRARFDLGLWKEVFEHSLTQNDLGYTSASLVLDLARNAK